MSKILVTKPFQAPFAEVSAEIQKAWDAAWLTNNGPLLRQLEVQMREVLGVHDCAVVGNGTIALQIALRAVEATGEIITTPFSYVATTTSILWEQATPVFVDIDPKTFNIDPAQIEAAITPKTTTILATHVFGVPCDVEAIEAIAKRHDLKVIYDAAHCFGTQYKGQSVLNYGDVSTLSMHATKLFHSVEGGAVFVNDADAEKIDAITGEVSPLRFSVDRLRNFGHYGLEKFEGIGINGKNSELHAAVGLVNLRYIDQIMDDRKRQHSGYDAGLAALDLGKPEIAAEVEWNRSYYPVVFASETEALAVMAALEQEDIFARRYFYPTLNSLEYIHTPGTTPVADHISQSILCLPLYFGLEDAQIDRISAIIVRTVEQFRAQG